MTHGRAVSLMVLVTLMWSTAGVVTRHLEAARSFEVTFWRSAFNALALVAACCGCAGRGCGPTSARVGGTVGVGPVLDGDVHQLHAGHHHDHRGHGAGHAWRSRRC
jgi:hypothetical protein